MAVRELKHPVVWLTPRLCYATALAGVAVMFGAALYMQHAMGLEPCALCMMQRIWVAATGVVALIALVHAPVGWGLYLYTGLGGGAALLGSGFSIRQMYLQSLPPDQVPACGPSLDYMLEVFPLSEVLEVMITGTGDCAVVQWSLLGLSIPGWTLIGFIGLAALFGASAFAPRNR